MGKVVTIGGERLGSGKKMKQAMHNYERSNHNQGYIWRSTMTAGTLVPFMSQLMLPGDTFDIPLEAEVLTHPTIGPLYGSFKLQLDVFQVPIRLYQAQLHNNKLGIGMNMSAIKFPIIGVTANNIEWERNDEEPIDVQQINPSSLLAYLGVRGIGHSDEILEDSLGQIYAEFNAIPYLAYWDIYKNYYANKQEEIGMFIAPEPSAINVTNAVLSRKNGSLTPVELPNQNGVGFAPITAQTTTYGREVLTFTPANAGETMNINELYVRVRDGLPQQPDRRLFRVTEILTSYGCVLSGMTGTTTAATMIEITHAGAGNIGAYVLLDAGTLEELEYRLYGEGINVKQFPLSNIDDMREDILAAIKNTEPFLINGETYSPYGEPLANIQLSDETLKYRNRSASYTTMCGLALKTYQSDLYNNWLSTEWIDGVNGIAEVSAIDVTDGSLRMDALNLAQKVYNMLNRIAVSGGSYYDWIEAVYTQEAYKIAETPVYCGGFSKEVVFQEVVSNSATSEEPLGSLAGKGKLAGGSEKGYVVVNATNEPCYTIGIVSLTPRIDYSQGNNWDVNLKTMDDLHKPELDGIGFQDLITEQMAAWDVFRHKDGSGDYRSAGKLPAWMNYMTETNKCYGLFADRRNEMFMTLNRKYEADIEERTIEDLTTYIHPEKFNYAFANTELAAQNFWVQISVGIQSRRKVSARQIPNL